MRIVYVKTITGSHYKLEGDIEVRSDAFAFQMVDKDTTVVFPWTNVERVEITDEEKKEISNEGTAEHL